MFSARCRTNQTQVLKTPIYWAFWIYVRNTGKWRVACDVDSPVGTMPVGGETPVVDASATLSDDGRTLFIGLINRHPESDVEVQLDLGNFKAKPTGANVATLERKLHRHQHL
jgi:alpha-L-arabinofuranosidase